MGAFARCSGGPISAGRRWLAPALAAILLGGCCHCPPKPPPPSAYLGPTLPIQQVIQKINAHNQKVPSIYAYLKSFDVLQMDQDAKPHNYSGDGGQLVYLKPHSLYLRGDTVAGEGFEIGTTDKQYWLKILGKVDTLWTGTYANISRVDARQLPIDPDLVLEVLGVSQIDTNLLQPPAPVMRFDNDQDAYVLVWSLRLPDRWAAQKEIWYDRRTFLPRQVRLYDLDGKMIVKAELFDPKPLPATQDDKPGPDNPLVATRYELYFPPTQTSLNLTLSEPSLTNDGTIPNEKTFEQLVKNLAHPGVTHMIDLDNPGAP